MRRLLAVAVLAVAALALAAPGAMAHPLGNFSINHLTKVKVSSDRVDVHYILDQAEIPTFQERDRSRGELLAAKRSEVADGLSLSVNGREVPLELAPGGTLTKPEGQGGLLTTRVELSLSAAVDDPRRVEVADETFPDRVGWKAIVAEPGEGTAVRSDAPSGDPTDGLRRYPEDLLNSPLDRRSATLAVEPGDGSLVAPRAEGERTVTTRDASGQGFARLFDDAAAGKGVLVLLLLAAFGWGALHALSPGHGKAMVAAYLIGTRGTPRHAVALGATVTITHTLGVFALGLVTLLLSQYILPEDLYPWLTLVSGLLVVSIGAGVLRARLRWARERRRARAAGDAVSTADHGPSAEAALHSHGPGEHGHHHHHGLLGRLLPHHHHGDGHGHSHAHAHGHSHGHAHSHSHSHGHGHSHAHTHGHSHDSNHEHGHSHPHAHGHPHDTNHEHGHSHPHAHGHPHDTNHEHGHSHPHAHGHPHDSNHEHGHSHPHAHGHPHDSDHEHGHSHAHPHTVTRRSLIGMGAAAGLIPCPSALVVLLGAIAQHEVALGLLLIVAFSVGLASTLTGLGLLVVYTRRLLPRVRLDGRLATALPAASALAIVIVGFVLTAKAVPGVV